ncbi:MAG TPA: (d)CMP kinase [Bryobacteraceae bacterium]|nr:(d)CMP kinase [Bryobacteraceae bacterium]
MGNIIAIDGPAGAGKSTIARALAERLGFTYIDTGAMYRTVALASRRAGLSLEDEDAVARLARNSSIEFVPVGRIFLNGEDVSPLIRTPEVTSAASKVAAMPSVRAILVEKQRRIGETGNVVMEGRDIGTVVFPHARVKIFLDADPIERVRRRGGDLPDVPLEQLAREIRERDERDSQRAQSPLVQAPDAVRLDSTRLTTGEVLDAILELVRSRIPLERAHGEG